MYKRSCWYLVGTQLSAARGRVSDQRAPGSFVAGPGHWPSARARYDQPLHDVVQVIFVSLLLRCKWYRTLIYLK